MNSTANKNMNVVDRFMLLTEALSIEDTNITKISEVNSTIL
jgi:hypothetical protein